MGEKKAKKKILNKDLFLAPLEAKRREAQIATLDIETSDWVKPYAVGFYSEGKYSQFDGQDCIQKALQSIINVGNKGKWIFAHNGGNFDFLFCVRELIKKDWENWEITIIPIQSTIIAIDIKSPEGWKIKLVDSVRLFPLKLDELGKTFGVGSKVEIKMSYAELAKKKNYKVMSEYLKQDCILLYDALQKFQTIIYSLGGQLSITLPATALDLFRRKYLKKKVYVNRHFSSCPEAKKSSKQKVKAAEEIEGSCRGCLHDFVRDSYFGGRTEIFRMEYQPHKAHEQAYIYDINSHYPHCMLDLMPVGRAQEIEGKDAAFVFARAKKQIGFVQCKVYIPDDCYLPPLPVTKKINGADKLIFPVGVFSGTWDVCELELLEKVGGKILDVRKSVWFTSSPIFANYVRRMYQFRNKDRNDYNEGLSYVAKILINSSYGKFAMGEERTSIVIGPDDPSGMKPLDVESNIFTEDVLMFPRYVIPQISSHITALARRKLWEQMQGVLDGGGKIYYCDTDSIVCSGAQIDTGNELGEMKLEETVLRARFALPKLYMVETESENTKKKLEKNLKVKAKGMGPGLPKSSADGKESVDNYAGQLSENEFLELLKGSPVERQRLTKIRESLNNYAADKLDFPRVIESVKSMRTSYNKRIILDDYNTKALVLTQ